MVSYKILLLSDFTFFKLFFHIFAAIIEALIVAGHKIFPTDLWGKKHTQISNFMKIRPVGAELFHADGQTHKHTGGHDGVISLFLKFCERS